MKCLLKAGNLLADGAGNPHFSVFRAPLKEKVMKIHESAIFKAHPQAAMRMRKWTLFHRLKIISMTITVIGFVAFTVTLPRPGIDPKWRSMVSMLITLAAYVVGLQAKLSGVNAIRVVENKVRKLAEAMRVGCEWLCSLEAESVKKVGWQVLVARATNKLILEGQIKQFKIGKLEQPLRNILAKAILDEMNRREEEIRDSYDALHEFGFVDGGYSKVFREAEASMTILK